MDRRATGPRPRASRRTAAERDRLVAENVRLVGHVLKGLLRRRGARPDEADVDDLHQEGLIGLVRAAELFDETRGVKFCTYACNVIASRLLNALRGGDLVRLPLHVKGERRERLRAALRPKRLDRVVRDGWDRSDGSGLAGALPDRPEAPHARYDLRRVLAHCSPRERVAVEGRANGETLDQVGARMGVCKERVRQILLTVGERMRTLEALGVDFSAE